jgi:hypothetical protein
MEGANARKYRDYSSDRGNSRYAVVSESYLAGGPGFEPGLTESESSRRVLACHASSAAPCSCANTMASGSPSLSFQPDICGAKQSTQACSSGAAARRARGRSRSRTDRRRKATDSGICTTPAAARSLRLGYFFFSCSFEFEAFVCNQAVGSPGYYFAVCENPRHSRGLGWRAPVSDRRLLAFWSVRGGFRAPVSARDFPISISAGRRPVRLLTETGSRSALRVRRRRKVHSLGRLFMQ